MRDDDTYDEAIPYYEAALRVWSETLSVEEMSRRLGEPTYSHERGDPKTKRYPDGARRSDSMWSRASGVDELSRLDEHVEAVLAFLETRREEVAAIRDACEMDIFCGVFHNDSINCSFILQPDLSRRLAEWALPLNVFCC